MANNMFLRFAIQRIVLSVVFVVCVLGLIASFRSLPTQDSPIPAGSTEPASVELPSSFLEHSAITSPSGTLDATKSSHRCDAFPILADTLIIVKTGANEVFTKLPTQLLTILQCYTDLLIFSDLEQQLGQYRIHNVLANVTESIKESTADFDYYRTLHQYQQDRQDISTIKSKTGDAAWNLDRFKFLHMLEKTWKMRPDRKWYVFIEADTYLVQSNLLLWLKRMDPTKLHYLGSPTSLDGENFAHGGSGFILSGAALSKWAKGDEGIAARYDAQMKEEFYGDYMLMKALRDKGITLGEKWPILQGETPSSLPFGGGPDDGVRHWCQPIVTMHHVSPDEVSRLWEFEGQREDVTKPLLIKELYEDFIAPHIVPIREDWYNYSDDIEYRAPGVKGERQKEPEEMTPTEKKAHLSFEDCGRACVEQQRCFQYVYSDKTCGFSYSFRLGYKRVQEGNKTFKSGFLLEKIRRYVEDNTCKAPEWL